MKLYRTPVDNNGYIKELDNSRVYLWDLSTDNPNWEYVPLEQIKEAGPTDWKPLCTRVAKLEFLLITGRHP